MKIFTFIFPSDSTDDQDRQFTTSKYIIANDINDAISVASEKGLTGYVHVSVGPDVTAVAGMFE